MIFAGIVLAVAAIVGLAFIGGVVAKFWWLIFGVGTIVWIALLVKEIRRSRSATRRPAPGQDGRVVVQDFGEPDDRSKP